MVKANFPTREDFLTVFELFPKGNPEDAFREIRYTMLTKTTFTGVPISWDIIKETFSKYIKKRKEEETQDKFIKGLQSFVKSGDYNIDFSKEPSQQKKNLFQIGLDESMDELEKRLKKNEESKRKL